MGTIPSHLVFPSLSNLSSSPAPTLTIPSSAGSLGAEINARAYGIDDFPHSAKRPCHREVPIDVPFEYMGYPVQPSPRPSQTEGGGVCPTPLCTSVGVGGMEDRPLPPIPHPQGGEVSSGGTQTKDEMNACTQTDKNSSTQTDNGTIRSTSSTATYESLTKYDKRQFDKRGAIKRKNSPRSISSSSDDDTSATYSSIDTLMKKADNANRKSFRSLNTTNISSWVFSTMNKAASNLSPKKDKNKDKIKNKKGKKPDISSPMPLQTPTGMKAMQAYPQVSTPFLSPKDKHKVEKLPGHEQNVGLTEWKSVSTLNTEHSGDSEAIYNQLHKIANVYSQ